MDRKDLRYYLNLDFDVKVVRFEDEDEVVYRATADELDPSVFYGVGETKEEALESFEHVRREMLQYYYEQGLPIPEPTREEGALPSGRFVLRILPATHRRLVSLAKRQGKSLNSYVESLLAYHVATEDVLRQADDKLEAMISRCEFRLQDTYNLKSLYPRSALKRTYKRSYSNAG